MNVVGMSARRVDYMLRGAYNTKVDLMVLPRGQMFPRAVTVVRDREDTALVSQEDVPTSEAIRSLRLPQFQSRKKLLRVVNFEPQEESLFLTGIRQQVALGVDDVSNCVAGVLGFPPDASGRFKVTYSLKGKGLLGVSIRPIDVDVQVCVASRASRWGLPDPEKAPFSFVVEYQLNEVAGASTPVPSPSESPTPSPTATPILTPTPKP